MVSLKDIAKECGVSTATVSKALNGQHDIGEETKARVRETAERMGYFPNAAARALKTNRSYNVGVLFQEEAGSGLTHEYFSGVLNGIKVQAEKMGYDVTFINNSYGVKKTSFFEHCRYRNFEGIVIVCADFASQGVLELMNSAFPVVTIDYTHYNCTAVCSNNVKGMEEITIRDLIRTALRMAPNRIIVGEIRGEEAVDLLQAWNTGHDGSLGTAHANSTGDMISRVETMVLMGMELPLEAVRRQIASGVELLVHLERARDGKRQVAEIAEILGYENGEVRMHGLYRREKDQLKRIGELQHREKLERCFGEAEL